MSSLLQPTLSSQDSTESIRLSSVTAPLTEDTRALVLQAEGVKLDKNARTTATQSDVDNANIYPTHCLICYGDLTHPSRTPCQHDEICGICHLRLRYLHNDTKCPICKVSNEQIIVDERSVTKVFSEYPMWGDSLGSNFHYQESVGMFFPIQYYEAEVQPLFGYYCTQPNCGFDGALAPDPVPAPQNKKGNKNNNNNNNSGKPPTPLRALQEHLRVAHRLALCQLCVDHQRDFVARLPRFTPNQLKQHLSRGDGPHSGFEGHPLCEFCRPTRFYDITGLHQHLHKEHYKCHVCEQQGLTNQFFSNYRSLERHFDQQHFLCHDVQCLEARFVVFSNELDLRHHERNVHGGVSQSSTKIQLEFRVRRGNEIPSSRDAPTEQDFQYGLDGQVFVPQELPQINNNDNDSTVALHPLHVQRTAQLREQAAALRRAESTSTSSVEAFPELEARSNTGSIAPLRTGWLSGSTIQRVGRRPIGTVTQEQFPALPSANSSANPSMSVLRFKNNTGATRNLATQRAIQSAANSGWNGTASLPTPSPAAVSNPTRPNSFLSSPSTPPSRNINQAGNLTAGNFPSLSGATQLNTSTNNQNNTRRYAAAEALVKKNQTSNSITSSTPSWTNNSEFPLPRASSNGSNNSTKNQQQQQSFRERMIGNQNNTPSRAAMNNVLQPADLASASASKARVEDVRAILGSNRFKKMQKFMENLEAGVIEPDEFVDHAANLFDKGYDDKDFWKFMPSVLSTCTNELAATQALSYIEHLRMNKNGSLNVKPSSAPTAASTPAATSWSSSFPSLSINDEQSSSTSTNFPAASGNWANTTSNLSMQILSKKPAANTNSVNAIRQTPPPPQMRAITKNKNVWGSNSPAITMTKAAPGMAQLNAAVRAGPTPGTATKFMAKDAKKQAQKVSDTSQQSNKKKNKQKDALRQLAFG